jgi:hypothetical protein
MYDSDQSWFLAIFYHSSEKNNKKKTFFFKFSWIVNIDYIHFTTLVEIQIEQL